MAEQAVGVDEVMAAAEAEADLHDWDGLDFVEHLRVLFDAVDASDAKSASKAGLRVQVQHTLADRLRLVDLLQREPEIEQVDVSAPIVVCGLPRTGSTFLGGLLAQDERNRTLRPDDSKPFGMPSGGGGGPGLVIDEGFLQRHLLEPPAEDVGLLDMELSLMQPCFFEIPEYVEHMLAADKTEAYRWHRRLLQLGQHRTPRERWSVRSPAHSSGVAEMLATYPDMKLVVTHRDPVMVVPSVCSLFEYLMRGNYDDPIDRIQFGRYNLDWWTEAIRRLLEARDAASDGLRCYDVDYRRLLTEPVTVVREIYEFHDLEWTGECEAAMRGWADGHRQEDQRAQFGTHKYSAEHYGLDPHELDRHFAFYNERFEPEPRL